MYSRVLSPSHFSAAFPDNRYFFKWIFGQLLAMMSLICWRLPNCDDDIIEVVEGTSMIIVLRRDFEAEAAEKVSLGDSTTWAKSTAVPLLSR